MRIIFAGTPEVAVPSLNSLVDEGHEVVGVITRLDAPLGRKRVRTPSPVALRAVELGIPLLKTNILGPEETVWAASLEADLGVIVAYGGLVRKPLLETPVHGWINLHFSDLPRWRGAAPVQRALGAGEQTLGISVFQLVEALDAGSVLTRDAKTYPLGTTAGEALTDLAQIGTAALLRAVEAVASHSEVATPQTGKPSYAHKLERSDGWLDVQQSATQVLQQWAGVTPEPGAYLVCGGEPLKILDLRLCERSVSGSEASEVATVAVASYNEAAATLMESSAILHVADGALELVRVQPAGRQAMNAVDWLRGRGGNVILEGVTR